LIDKLFDAPDEETAIDEKQPKQVEPTHQDEMTKKASENTAPVPSQKEVEAYLLQRRKQQVKKKLIEDSCHCL
jgi:pre-mRNA-splicing factor ISY1